MIFCCCKIKVRCIYYNLQRRPINSDGYLIERKMKLKCNFKMSTLPSGVRETSKAKFSTRIRIPLDIYRNVKRAMGNQRTSAWYRQYWRYYVFFASLRRVRESIYDRLRLVISQRITWSANVVLNHSSGGHNFINIFNNFEILIWEPKLCINNLPSRCRTLS